MANFDLSGMPTGWSTWEECLQELIKHYYKVHAYCHMLPTHCEENHQLAPFGSNANDVNSTI
jgi:hypothetical protein